MKSAIFLLPVTDPVSVARRYESNSISRIDRLFRLSLLFSLVALCAPAFAQTNEWAWMGGSSTVTMQFECQSGAYGTPGTPGTANIPGGREDSSAWVDPSGNFWLFGGQGCDSNGNIGELNDMWKYTPSTGQWTWVTGASTLQISSSEDWYAPGTYGTLGAFADGNTPSGREGAPTWVDYSGNLWLLGGFGSFGNVSSGYASGWFNDLWEFSPSKGQWAWMGGSNSVPSSQQGVAGVYGTLGTAAAANVPGGRTQAVSWVDSSGNLWLFGGWGLDANVADQPSELNDLWEFNTSTTQWTWVGGSNAVNATGAYGNQGSASAANVPGARYLGNAWADSSGNLWLFGGQGYDGIGDTGQLNDLWKYNPSNNQWTWVTGSSTVGYDGQSGVYGTLGVPSATNTPGGRYQAVSWTDSSSNFWLYGGSAVDSVGDNGYATDLWEFNPSAGEWTWVSGSDTVPNGTPGPAGVYGTLGTPAAANMPGGRIMASAWIDTPGNLWLFGGQGYDSTTTLGDLNDLWEYLRAGAGNPMATNPTFTPPAGNYASAQSVTINDSTAGAIIYYTTDGTTPTASSSVFSSPIAVSSSETIQAIAAATGYTNSAVASAAYTIGALAAAATPTFNPPAGTYTSAQSVTIADSTAGATIYYTIDGSTPTPSSAVFSGPIAVSSSVTIQAIATASGSSTSAMASAAYTISSSSLQWVQLTPTGATPPTWASYSPIVVGDPVTNTMFLFGGFEGYSESTNTWLLNNANGMTTPQWAGGVGPTETTPPGRSGGLGAYDSVNNRFIVFAGCGGTCEPVLNDTWVLSNANDIGGTPTWTQLSPTGGPPAARQGLMGAYDAGDNLLIVFGGQNGSGLNPGNTYSDVWVLSNANGLGGTPAWTQLSPTGGPPPGQVYGTAAYDPASNRLIVLGGDTGTGTGAPTNSVWALTNANGKGGTPAWVNLIPDGASGSPAAATVSAAAYDSASNTMMTLWYGYPSSGPVWELTNANGVSGTPVWTQLPNAPGNSYGVLFDAAHKRLTSIFQATTSGASSPNPIWILAAPDPAPTFSPAAGTFTSAQSVTISDSASGAVIYYTTDGSVPTTKSTKYTAAIAVSATETIQAIAAGYPNSPVASAKYTINLPPPNFTLGSSASTLSISSGGQGNVTLTVTPQNGFNAAVTFACSGLPSGATCSFSPSSVTPSGGTAITTQLTIAASTSVSAARPVRNPFLPAAGLALAGCLLAFTRRRALRLWLVLLAAIAILGAFSACGGGSNGGGGGGGGGSQTATVTVTATSGSLNQSTTITLTVN